jgi:hypothetical protein
MLPSFRRASEVRTLRPDAGPHTLRVRDELAQSSPCALFGWVDQPAVASLYVAAGPPGVSGQGVGVPRRVFLGSPAYMQDAKTIA